MDRSLLTQSLFRNLAGRCPGSSVQPPAVRIWTDGKLLCTIELRSHAGMPEVSPFWTEGKLLFRMYFRHHTGMPEACLSRVSPVSNPQVQGSGSELDA